MIQMTKNLYKILEKSKFYERLCHAFEQTNIFLFPHIVPIKEDKLLNVLSNKIYHVSWLQAYIEEKFVEFVLSGTGITFEYGNE
jgi:hypothetical protein